MSNTALFSRPAALLGAAAFLLTGLAAPAAADTTPAFNITLLGNLPGGNSSWAWDVTPDGDVVGSATTVGITVRHAFYWDAATAIMSDLGTLVGPAGESEGLAVASDRHAAGNSDQFGTLNMNGFYDPPGGPMLPVMPPPSGYIDPNAQDIEFLPGHGFHRAVGYAQLLPAGTTPHAAYWDLEPGSAVSLGTLTGNPTDWSRAFGVNSAGDIVGFSTRGVAPGHAFIWPGAGPLVDIDPRPGGGDSFANGVNNSQQVVGFFYASFSAPSTACRYDERADGWHLTDLGCLSPVDTLYADAHDISDGALIAGYSDAPGPEHGRTATMWLNDQIYDLNALVADCPIYLVEATGVNLAGQIVGYGTDQQTLYNKAFRLDPASLMLMQPVPGNSGRSNDFYSIGAVPGDAIYFVYGFAAGSTPVPGCSGLVVDIASPKIVGSPVADAHGVALLSSNVPPAAAGVTILIQAVDPAACVVSNLIRYTFY